MIRQYAKLYPKPAWAASIKTTQAAHIHSVQALGKPGRRVLKRLPFMSDYIAAGARILPSRRRAEKK